jgi:subtilisin
VRPMRTHSVLTLLILLALGTAVLAAGRQNPAGRRVLVGFRPDTGPRTAEARADVVRQRGGTIHRSLRLVSVVSATLAPEAIEKLRAQSDIAYIEDDVVLHALGQTMAWGVDRTDADLAWPAGNTGKGVQVAILDTGIDPTHPDLGVAGGVNFAGSTKDGSTNSADWNDGHGHGTHCAGIAAAHNNTIGVVGVAPDATLWAVKVLSDAGSGYTSDIIQGLDWCAAHGIKVASMSLGGGGTASLQAACDRAFSQGVVLVAAAGNSSGPVMYPAAYSSVIAVSATDSRDLRASFSNYGPQIAVAAPGVSIYSTYKGGSYATMSGTSMACPHVAGAAALAWASGLTSAQAVRDRLTTTAEDLGTPGFDTSYGYGLVDAQKAAGSSGSGGGGTPPVDNPPTVGITAPAQGATVAKTVAVQATANDDHGVAQVEFLVDGARIGVDSSGGDGWSASWDTTRSPDGQHTVAATTVDTAGKTASSSVTVIVRNAVPVPTGKMSVSSITYSTSGLNNADLTVAISVVSGSGAPMANAFVWASVYLNGRVCLTPIGTTNASGSASFKLVRASSGTYKTMMVRVSASGQIWDGATPPNEFTK